MHAGGHRFLGSCSQALEFTNATQRLCLSGQAPRTKTDGAVPETFKEQAKTVCNNLLAQWHDADLIEQNSVKAATFLANHADKRKTMEVRDAILNGHQFMLTVVLAGMFEEDRMFEIDAIAEE